MSAMAMLLLDGFYQSKQNKGWLVEIMVSTFINNQRQFFRDLLKLSLPIILQNLFVSSLGYIDILMIGQLDEASIAAVGIANQFTYVFIVVQFGVHSGISIFTAQYWGKKDIQKVQQALGASFNIGLTVGIFFLLAAVIFPELILSVFTSDTAVIALGADYLRITGAGYLFMVMTFSYTANLKSTGFVRVPMVVSFFSVIINITLNYLLIFGKLGFPVMGVNGAALATWISKLSECILIIFITYRFKYPSAANIFSIARLSGDFLKKILQGIWPVLTNDVIWVLGVSIYKLIYARIGIDAIAAVNIVVSIEDVAFLAFFGLTGAGAITTGNLIGAGKKEEAYRFARKLLIIKILAGVMAGIIIFAIKTPLLSLYNISEATRLITTKLLQVVCLVFWMKTVNMGLLIGFFRGGGDTKYGMVLEVSGVWGIGIPLALIGAFVLDLPIYWVYLLIASEEIYKLFVGLTRFKSKKWMHDLVTQV